MSTIREEDLQSLSWALDNVHGYLTDNSCSDPDCCGGPHYSEEEYQEGLVTMARFGLTLAKNTDTGGKA